MATLDLRYIYIVRRWELYSIEQALSMPFVPGVVELKLMPGSESRVWPPAMPKRRQRRRALPAEPAAAAEGAEDRDSDDISEAAAPAGTCSGDDVSGGAGDDDPASDIERLRWLRENAAAPPEIGGTPADTDCGDGPLADFADGVALEHIEYLEGLG